MTWEMESRMRDTYLVLFLVRKISRARILLVERVVTP